MAPKKKSSASALADEPADKRIGRGRAKGESKPFDEPAPNKAQSRKRDSSGLAELVATGAGTDDVGEEDDAKTKGKQTPKVATKAAPKAKAAGKK